MRKEREIVFLICFITYFGEFWNLFLAKVLPEIASLVWNWISFLPEMINEKSFNAFIIHSTEQWTKKQRKIKRSTDKKKKLLAKEFI